MGKRSETLEFAVLGLLSDTPLHGYELRKRLNLMFGPFRALSYGTLYPCLRRLTGAGLIREYGLDHTAAECTGRHRISYILTDDGAARLAANLSDTGPAAWDDDQFGVHFSFFSRIDPQTRLHILQGRRARLTERLAVVDQSLAKLQQPRDRYAVVLQQHGRDSLERELGWLDELIGAESAASTTTTITRRTRGN
ncbi:PadR family transcriptional regulator [Arthrobacter castelli]|uniref:PadR family transcriptional regulator n=1 Tax=Arthrobacter castelli TaxID=271431 RepID=UPI0004098FA6|nr:PadR family transcriptional regulator [Arthrobacter castelli]